MRAHVVTVGRIGIDLYGQEPGSGLEDPQTFAKAVGGSPTNVAVGLARHGHRAMVLTAVGDDALGRFARAELTRHGVDTSLVLTRPGKTPIVLAGTRLADAPELVFYRDSPAPDTCISLDELSPSQLQALEAAQVLWISASALAVEPLASSVRTLLGRNAAAQTVLDLDYRASFWPRAAAAHSALQAILPQCDVVVGNLEECAVATGLPASTTPPLLAAALHARGPHQVLVKAGAQGVLASQAVQHKDATALPSSTEACMVAGLPVTVHCGLGAGDAFGAALVHGLIQGWPLPEAARFANAAGAIVASRLLCSDAMPYTEEVERLLEAHP